MRKSMAFLIVSFYMLAGCSSSSSDFEPKLNCLILIGQGGGFTGSYEGICVDSTGKVFKWTGKTFDSALKTFSKELNKEEIYSINNLIDTSGVQNTKYAEHGDISTFIIINTDKGENRISWRGIDPDSKVPLNIRSFYSEIKKITN